MDPYVVSRLIIETVCGAASRTKSSAGAARQAVPA
jgi:hypothetical protein